MARKSKKNVEEVEEVVEDTLRPRKPKLKQKEETAHKVLKPVSTPTKETEPKIIEEVAVTVNDADNSQEIEATNQTEEVNEVKEEQLSFDEVTENIPVAVTQEKAKPQTDNKVKEEGSFKKFIKKCLSFELLPIALCVFSLFCYTLYNFLSITVGDMNKWVDGIFYFMYFMSAVVALAFCLYGFTKQEKITITPQFLISFVILACYLGLRIAF